MPTDKKSTQRSKMQPVDHEGTVAHLHSSYAEKYRARLAGLFADLESLACSPACNTPEIHLEIEALRARLLELEKDILEN